MFFFVLFFFVSLGHFIVFGWFLGLSFKDNMHLPCGGGCVLAGDHQENGDHKTTTAIAADI